MNKENKDIAIIDINDYRNLVETISSISDRRNELRCQIAQYETFLISHLKDKFSYQLTIIANWDLSDDYYKRIFIYLIESGFKDTQYIEYIMRKLKKEESDENESKKQ